MLLKANKLLKLFMIRRSKGEVERLMPKKIETKVNFPCRPLGLWPWPWPFAVFRYLKPFHPHSDSLPFELDPDFLVQRIPHGPGGESRQDDGR